MTTSHLRALVVFITTICLVTMLAGCGGDNSDEAASGPIANAEIANYSLVHSIPVSSTDHTLTYRATLKNSGDLIKDASARVTSDDAGVVIVDPALTFGNISAGASVPSSDTFTLRLDRSKPFDPATLRWSISASPSAAIALLEISAASAVVRPGTSSQLQVRISRNAASTGGIDVRITSLPPGIRTLALRLQPGTDEGAISIETDGEIPNRS